MVNKYDIIKSYISIGRDIMFNLSLTACSFSMRKANSHGIDKIFNLNEPITYIDKESKEKVTISVFELFEKFFETYSQSVNDENKQKTFNCTYDKESSSETDSYIYTYVLIKSGNYGSSSEIKNLETQQVVYNKKANEAEEKPFYLFIVIPKDSTNIKVQKGIFMFQNVGSYGVKTITTEYMKDYFSDNFNISLNCKTVAPKLFLDKVLKRESIRKLYLTKNHKSYDTADNLSIGYGVETRVLANLHFTIPLWEKISHKINHFIAGQYNLFEFESNEYDGLKIEVDIGGTTRKINMRNIDNLSIIERIPDEIRDVDGHPKKDELIDYLQKVTEEYLKEMVLRIT